MTFAEIRWLFQNLCSLKNYGIQNSVAQGLTVFQTLADGTRMDHVLSFNNKRQLISNWGPMFITFHKSIAMVFSNSP